jgi:hypothetical protein
MDLADLIELGRVVFGARADTKEKLLLDLANRFFISDFLGCLSSMQRSNIKLGAHRSKCAASHGGASVPATKRATSANVGADVAFSDSGGLVALASRPPSCAAPPRRPCVQRRPRRLTM